MVKTESNATEKILRYIDSMPEFAQLICTKLREIILQADPSLSEEWKWGPHYSSNGMVCGYGGFKSHVKLTFFNGSGMTDSEGIFNHCVDNEFSRSVKYTDISEINAKKLTQYIREAVALNKKGFKRQVTNKSVEVPDDLLAAFKKNSPGLTFFDNLSYGYKKEYVEWVTAAKREETRKQRIDKVVSMCGEARKLNDKYK